MKNLYILIIGLLICFTATGQTDHLLLYKLPDKTKVRKIKLNSHVSIKTALNKTDTTRSWNYFHGKLVKVDNGTFTVKLTNVKISNVNTSGIKKETFVKSIVYNDSTPDGIVQKSFAYDDIDFIRHSKKHKTIEGIGTGMAWIGAFTTLILAPLVSINYSDWTFNANTYKNYALAGTAMIAVSIPILFCTNRNRTFQIRPGWDENNKKLWSLRKE